MAAQSRDAAGTGLKELFGLIGGFTAVVYVFGFLVVHAYLDPFQVAPQGLANTRYLSAGLCFAFFYAAAAVAFVLLPGWSGPLAIATEIGAQLKARLAGKDSGYALGFRLTFPVFFVLGRLVRVLIENLRYYGLFLLITLPAVWLTASDMGLFASPWLYLWTVLVMISFALGFDLVTSESPARWKLLPWLLSFMLVSALIFGTRVYTLLSPSIGGGIPLPARFVIGDDVPATVREALGDPVGDLSRSMWVLLETGDSYFVVVPHTQGPALELKKGLVKAVQFGKGR